MYSRIIHAGGVTSQVVVGDSYQNLPKYLPSGKRIIVITDANILRHYGDFLRPYPVIEIGVGEKHKNLDTLSHIYDRLLQLNADRDCFIVGVGGGIVCDVAGFAASTFMRGLPFGFISTTLLSQVDASVGGKNGINFGGFKNMIGTFNQPEFVLCDPEIIQTLPDAEYVSGFAEIVKAAVIRNSLLFDYLEQHVNEAMARDVDVIRHLIIESIKIKADVVEHDEHEQGERRTLNFGHTFGHAVEVQSGISHGAAISVGMMIAARWSEQECGFPSDQTLRLEELLVSLGLPVKTEVSPDDMIHALTKDKKRENDAIHLVLLKKIGETLIRKTRITDIERKLPSLL